MPIVEKQVKYLVPNAFSTHNKPTVCLFCGTWQDSVEGSGHGTCGACITGFLVAYGDKQCAYKNCKNRAVTEVPYKHRACFVHVKTEIINNRDERIQWTEKSLHRSYKTVTIQYWTDDATGTIDYKCGARIVD